MQKNPKWHNITLFGPNFTENTQRIRSEKSTQLVPFLESMIATAYQHTQKARSTMIHTDM